MTDYVLAFEGDGITGAWVIRPHAGPIHNPAIAVTMTLSADDDSAARHWARRALAARGVTVTGWQPNEAGTRYTADATP